MRVLNFKYSASYLSVYFYFVKRRIFCFSNKSLIYIFTDIKAEIFIILEFSIEFNFLQIAFIKISTTILSIHYSLEYYHQGLNFVIRKGRCSHIIIINQYCTTIGNFMLKECRLFFLTDL